tara:strand:- start:14822 stop:16699 length:1878 start_codon:yes stop_codon:yes gene_type:complete
MDYYKWAKMQIANEEDILKAKLSSLDNLSSAMIEGVAFAGKLVKNKKEKQSIDAYGEKHGWFFDKNTDRYYQLLDEGGTTKLGEISVPDMKLYKKLDKEGVSGVDTEQVYRYNDGGDIIGFKENIETDYNKTVDSYEDLTEVIRRIGTKNKGFYTIGYRGILEEEKNIKRRESSERLKKIMPRTSVPISDIELDEETYSGSVGAITPTSMPNFEDWETPDYFDESELDELDVELEEFYNLPLRKQKNLIKQRKAKALDKFVNETIPGSSQYNRKTNVLNYGPYQTELKQKQESIIKEEERIKALNALGYVDDTVVAGEASSNSFNPEVKKQFLDSLTRTIIKPGTNPYNQNTYNVTPDSDHPIGSYIPAADKEKGVDKYVEKFTIDGKLQNVLVTEDELYLLNSGEFDRGAAEAHIKATAKKNLEKDGKTYPEVDESTGLYKFEAGDVAQDGTSKLETAGSVIGAASSVLSFIGGVTAGTRKYQAQKRSAFAGIKGMKSDMGRARENLQKDTDMLVDKYNLGVKNLVGQFAGAGKEFGSQLEGIFKKTGGLAGSSTTDLKERTLSTLNDAFESKQEELEFDFDSTYDKYLRDFESKNESNQLKMKDLMATYNYARKHDRWYNNLI